MSSHKISQENYSFVYVGKVGKRLNKQEMCVTLEEQQFPVSLSYRMRFCKLFVAAEGVEAENLAQTQYLGASPKGEREKCGRG